MIKKIGIPAIILDVVRNKKSGFFTLAILINYRIGRVLLRLKKKYGIIVFPIYVIPYFLGKTLGVIIGCSIPFSAKIGAGVKWQHGFHGIFISGNAIIGDNCVILHHVTIGSNSNSSSEKRGAPIIGGNVFIGVGAKIIGRVVVGDNCKIGANSLIVKNMPSNCVAKAPLAEIMQMQGNA